MYVRRGLKGMLREVMNARQVPGEPFRRWFSDEGGDLVVWYDEMDGIYGFQFCFGKGGDERAVSWTREAAFSFRRVDDGEHAANAYKMSPVLAPDPAPDLAGAAAEFAGCCQGLPEPIAAFVQEKLDRIKTEGTCR